MQHHPKQTHFLPPSARQEAEGFLKDLERQSFFLNRLLEKVKAANTGAYFDGLESNITQVRGMLRTTQEALHQQTAGKVSYSWKAERPKRQNVLV